MKKALYLLLFFFGIAYGDNSQRISQIHFEVKSLEDQKPVLFEVIKYTETAIPDIRNAKKQTEKYRDEMKAHIADNLDKALKTGALNFVVEINGARNGGKLVELAAWVTGKIVDIGMGKSGTFGGVSHYKQKLDGVSKEYQNLIPELTKLHQISQSSTEAMQSYYSKYGKYSDKFELGETGVFIQRMRLIAEQADVAFNALENLDLQLTRMLDEAQMDLRNLERQIQVLREELKKLNEQDKESKLKEPEKKLELSLEDKQTGILPEIKSASVQLPNMPNSCYKSYKTKAEYAEVEQAANNALNKALGYNNTIKDLIQARYEEQNAYLISIKEKYASIKAKYDKGIYYPHALDGDAHEKVKQGIYPTGEPFNVFLEDTARAGQDLDAKIRTFQDDLKQLTDEMLLNIPTSYDEIIMQNIKNRDTYATRYTAIHHECFRNSKTIGMQGWYPSQGVVDELKGLKTEYLRQLEKINQLADDFPKWLDDRMQTLKAYFAKRRGEMQEEISRYEKEISEQDAMRSNIMNLVSKAMGIYEGNDFIRLDNAASYSYIPKTKMQDTICKTITALRSEFNSGTPSAVLNIEQNIKNLQTREKYYGTSGFPIHAYIEFGIDVEKLQQEQSNKAMQYSLSTQAYNTSGSNIQYLLADLEENKFYQLGLLNPNTIFKEISDKQMQALKDIKSSIQNFKVQTKNSLDSSHILDSEKEDFKAFHKHIEKMFSDNFGCLPLNHDMIAGLMEEIEELKLILSKVNLKQTYMDASSLFNSLQALSKTVDDFAIDIDSPEKFNKEYQAIRDEYDRIYELVNTTYASTLFDVDKRKLNEILLSIESKLSGSEEHRKFISQQGDISLVENLYERFAQEYSNKNLSSLMSLISDEWSSSSDGTTLMDLEDTLGNSFSIFDDIECSIENLSIQSHMGGRFRVSYTITIEGYMYANDIRHIEKSSVIEEVVMEDGKARIVKTTGGRFWPVR